MEETNAFQILVPGVPIILYSADMDGFVEKEGICGRSRSSDIEKDVVANPIPTARSLLESLAAGKGRQPLLAA